MNSMNRMITKLVVILVLFEVSCLVEAAAAKKKPSGSTANNVDIITKKLKSATPAQLAKYRGEAAKRLQNDVARAFQALSGNNKEIPGAVRNSAKVALKGVRSGKLNAGFAKNMPAIMQQASMEQGKPASQLKAIITNVLPNAPADLKAPLKNVEDFLSTNLNGLNTLLGKLLGGVPDLLSGVVKSLTSTLGGVTDALNGAVGSLGKLMGSLLSG